MESEERGNNNSYNGIGDKKETHTTRKHLEGLQHKAVLVYQAVSQNIPRSTFQLLDNHFKLQEASIQLTKDIKKANLNTIVLYK